MTDRARVQPKTWPRLKRAAIIAAVGGAVISGGVILANIDFSTHRVDLSKLTIQTVQRGTMEIKVAANGQLVAKRIQRLVAAVTARVMQADIKPGAVVRQGDVLVQLANPALLSSADEAQSAWEGAAAELQAAEAEFRDNVMNQQVVLTQVQFEKERAQLKLEKDEMLTRQQLLSALELRNAQLELSQHQQTYEIQSNRLQTIRDNVQSQLAVKRARVNQLARALDRARMQVAGLEIMTGLSGIVQTIDVEVGQLVQPGSAVGRVAQVDQLYAELKVAAREATQVRPGQHVVVDTRTGTIDGVVTRVDPAVKDGTVVVDADLLGPLPPGARPQLQIEGIVYISQVPDALFVAKPAYVKNDAAISVYKLDPTSRYASRVTIKAGQVSVTHVQVLGGLHAGDRIITSEIGEWQGQERILLN